MFIIYMGEPVGSRFRQIVNKIQDWQVSSRNRVYHLQLHFSKCGREGLKLVSKMYQIFVWNMGKQDYFFRRPVAPGNFPPKRPQT